MRYEVYAGQVEVDFETASRARFHWTKKTLVYDSYGDAVEGDETEGILAEPVVELADREAGSFSCRVPCSVETRMGPVKNPYYDDFLMGKTFVQVDEDGECIFFGRVNECELEFNLDKAITADGILNELERMQTRLSAGSYQTTSDSGSSILSRVFAPKQSEKGLSPVNCMERGNVTVESKSVSTENSGDQFGSYWSVLTTYLLENDKAKDGYLRLRMANDPGTENYFFYYDYLLDKDLPATNQTIEYGVNMLDFTFDEKRGTELVNSVTAHGVETEKRGWWIFSRTSYNAITGTASDEFSIANYGLCSKHIYVDGKKSTTSSLNTAAQEELKNYKQTAEPTLTVKAFDRRDAGEKVDKLGYLLRTHILSEPHDMDRWMVCTKLRLPLDAPDSKEFTFGLTSAKLSKRILTLSDMVTRVVDAIHGLVGHVNEVT